MVDLHNKKKELFKNLLNMIKLSLNSKRLRLVVADMMDMCDCANLQRFLTLEIPTYDDFVLSCLIQRFFMLALD